MALDHPNDPIGPPPHSGTGVVRASRRDSTLPRVELIHDLIEATKACIDARMDPSTILNVVRVVIDEQVAVNAAASAAVISNLE